VIRVQIADSFAFGFGVAILIADRPGENAAGMPYRALRFGEGGSREWEHVTDVYAGSSGPTLVLEEDEARALLDALTRYYHGAEDTRALRKDYDAERARVDKLTATLGDVVKALVSEP
jgi:hypothetical protein